MTTNEGTVELTKNEQAADLIFERKLDAAVDGLPPFYKKSIMNLSQENAKLVVDFINSELQFSNIKVIILV